ncbi:MAG: DUF7507 domain-containing protein [Clostridium sp.]
MSNNQFTTNLSTKEDIVLSLSCNKGNVVLGDLVTFTLIVLNRGILQRDNLNIVFPLKNGLTINNSTLSVNNEKVEGDIIKGFSINSLPSNESRTISFEGLITQVPTFNPISLVSKAILTDGGIEKVLYSNNLSLGFSYVHPSINVNKIADKSVVAQNEEVKITSIITNLGDVNVKDTLFIDPIPKYATIISGSMKINGVSVTGGDIAAGIKLGDINSGDEIRVEYSMSFGVEALGELEESSSKIIFSYETGYGKTKGVVGSNLLILNVDNVNDTINDSSLNSFSSRAMTPFALNEQPVAATAPELPSIKFTKSVDKTGAIVGETLTYDLNLSNIGNVAIQNVLITDIVPLGTQFIQGSVFINGTNYPAEDVGAGINLGNIDIGQVKGITFKVTVTELPNINPIYNKAVADYSYIYIQGNPPVNASIQSNDVGTKITQKDIITNLYKTANKNYANIGDTITFTLQTSNNSIITANNCEFIDYTDNRLSFIPGSVLVNGISKPNDDIRNGVNVDEITPNESVIVQFQAMVNTDAKYGDTIKNNGSLQYEFLPSHDSNLQERTIYSNTTSCQVNAAVIQGAGLTKSLNKAGGSIGDIITYTINMTNSGNVSADNIVLVDAIQSGTAFVPGTVKINGIASPQSNPQNGISIGSIAASQNSVVSFDVKITSMPQTNPVPNQATVTYDYKQDPNSAVRISVTNKTNTTQLNVVQIPISPGPDGFYKRVDLSNSTLGDIIIYTVTAQNASTVAANNVVMTDVLDPAVQFIDGSLTIDGQNVIANPVSGVNLGTIDPLQGKIVQFKVRVIAIPSSGMVKNFSNLSYNFTKTPGEQPNNVNISSNTVMTNVNIADISNGSGGLTKSQNKDYCGVNDIITYTAFVKNTGNVTANNVIIYDTIPSYTKFVEGSVIVGGTIKPLADPQAGVNIGNVGSGQAITLSYNVKVITIPRGGVINNSLRARYDFTVDPNQPDSETVENTSNTVSCVVREAIIDVAHGLSKQANTSYVKTGDFINYDITIENVGNADAINVVFTDTIASQTEFQINSVAIDGNKIPGADVRTGVQVGTIKPLEVKIVSFTVKVTNYKDGDVILNTGVVDFDYIVNPSTGQSIHKTSPTNTTSVKINEARIDPANGDLVKSVDKEFAGIGDVLTYSTRIRNSGTTDASNITFTDKIPTGTVFIGNSFTIDGQTVPGVNPDTGVLIGLIKVNQIVDVEFQVSVVSVPASTKILNQSSVTYNYLINPNSGRTGAGQASSNTVNTTVLQAVLNGEKSADKQFVKIGDIIYYTITVNNTGNTTANDVQVIDKIQDGTSLVDGSVKLNGNPADPSILSGTPIGSIKPLAGAIITFGVIVTKIPPVNPVINTAQINYNYIVNPSTGEKREVQTTTNNTKTQVNQAIINYEAGGFTKYEDRNAVALNDTITYKISLTNTGNVNGTDLVLTDVLDPKVTFVPGSLLVNGQPFNGNIQGGINLGILGPNKNTTVVFKVVATTLTSNTIPNTATLTFNYVVNTQTGQGVSEKSTSNTVIAVIRDPQLSIKKYQSKNYATTGDVITYTLVVSGKGNVDSTKVMVYDTLPSGLTFIQGSVMVNGVSLPAQNPTRGIEIGNLDAGAMATVTFKVLANTVSDSKPYNNIGVLNYSFEVDESTGILTNRTTNSNQTTLYVNNADISYGTGGLIKSVDTQFGTICDVVTYTFTLKNMGNTIANAVVLRDTLPNSLKYMDGSVTVNGVPYKTYSPLVGIPVGSLDLNQVITVTFKGTIVSLPKPNVIDNVGVVNYKYTIDPSIPNGGERTNTSNKVTTVVNYADISTISGGLVKTVCRKYAKIGDTIDYTISMTNKGNVIAEEVILADTLVKGLRYVNNSLIIDGVLKPLDDLSKGVLIGPIAPNQTVIAQFSALVVSIPNNFIATNLAQVSYKYLVNPIDIKYCSDTNQTNTVSTQINMAEISNETGGLIKEVSKKYTELNEVLSYVIKITNKGNVPAIDVLFQDTIPVGTSYIKDSFAVNGVIQEGVNPVTGITLSTIAGGQSATLTFKVLVNTLVDKILANSGNVSYCYMVDETGCNSPCPQCCQNECSNCCRKFCETNATNTVFTTLSHGEVDVIKKVSENYATLNDTITYFLNVINNGNVDANNVFIQDTLPKGVVYIDNSLKINDVLAVGENIQRGIDLKTLKPKEVVRIQFNGWINTIPSGDKLVNYAYSAFNYYVDPTSLPITKNVLSNTVTTTINYALISNAYGTLNKYESAEFVDIGDVITYTIRIENKGNSQANNLVFTDSIPNGTSFINNSLKLNGIPITGGVPQTGVDIGTLAPNEKAVVTFDVKVITIPKGNYVINQGELNYRFTKNPNVPYGEVVYEKTNSVKAKVNHGEITNGSKETPGSQPQGGFTKQVDKNYSKLGDVITYTFYIRNSGNVVVTNVKMEDKLQTELQFVNGTVTIDDIPKPSINLKDGILVGDIKPGDKVKVTFKALVVSLPEDKMVENKATLEYWYKVQADKQPVIKTAESNEEIVNVQCAIISNKDGGLVKQVDKKYAELNDELSYTVTLRNTGNVVATEVVFRDQIAFGTNFVKDSLAVNGVRKLGANPQIGVTLPNIKPKENVVITFKTKIVAVTPTGIIPDTAEILYKYKVDPNKPEVEDESLSNTVNTKLNTVDFSGDNFLKSVCPDNAIVGESITYTFVIRNNGNVNANKVLLTDTLPSEVKFVEGSVMINGQPVEGGDPRVGIGLASIAPKQTMTVSFNVIATSFLKEKQPIINVGKLYYENVVNPNNGPVEGKVNSNPGKLYVKSATIEAIKTPMSKITAVGDEIWYKVTLTNKGNTVAKNVEIYDELPDCLKFVENSVEINGMDTKYSIISGVPVGNIDPSETVEIMFRTMVINNNCDHTIVNTIKGTGCYFVSSTRPDALLNFESNTAVVEIVNPELKVTKMANKEIAKYCDEVCYRVIVENVGSLNCFNVKLFDLLPEELKLLGDMVIVSGKKINGVNLSQGVNLGKLSPGEGVEVLYTAVVTRGCCRKIIENKAYAEYKYQICPEVCPKTRRSNVACYRLQGVSTSFQQISMDNIIKLPCRMPYIKDILDVRGKIQITNQYVIETIRGYSAENKRLTGHKLVLNGKIFECLEYIAQEPTCTTHYQEAMDKFSTFIMLSEDYKAGSNIEVVAQIEDIGYEQISDCEVFVTATIILDAIVTC